MGTYRGFKTEVIGQVYEAKRIKTAILKDKELALSLDKWDRHVKNWTPDEKILEISKQCKNSYILLTTAESTEVSAL
jgi:hypothetical protein